MGRHWAPSTSLLFLAALALSLVPSCSPDRPALEGTEWVLQQPGIESSALARSDVTIAFGPDGTVTGFYTYLSYSGSYAVDGDSLTISDICWLSLMCQAETPLQAPQAFIDTLASASSFSIAGDTLTIHAGDGELAFARAS